MNGRQISMVVIVWGVLTVVTSAAGWDTLGGMAALVQVCLLVGSPLALTLRSTVRSPTVVAVLAVALSLAITAVAAQSLIWFSIASRSLIVVAATLYGVGLGALVGQGLPEPAPRR